MTLPSRYGTGIYERDNGYLHESVLTDTIASIEPTSTGVTPSETLAVYVLRFAAHEFPPFISHVESNQPGPRADRGAID
jgi:hypothetical protein